MNDHIKSEISGYLAGGLPESRNRQIEAHAAACEKCQNALSKARSKQARVKREALKKASPERIANLFLARQGKMPGPDILASRQSWLAAAVIVVAGGGYWVHRHSGKTAHAPVEMADVPAAIPSAAPPAPVKSPPAKVRPPPAVPPETPKPPLVLPILQNWKGPDCGIGQSRLVVIRDDDAWEKLWTEMQSQDPPPEVEFSRKVVLGVFAGEEPAGTSVVLGKIEEMDGVMYAPYRILTRPVVPASSATAPSAPQAVTHPYLLAVVPRVNKKIRLTLKENPT